MTRRRTLPGDAMLKGALAGVVAGGAVLIARRLQDTNILEPERFRDDRWDRFIRRTARRLGLHLDASSATLAGAATYLTYSAALGALFGLARKRLPLSVSATAMLESALIFAASVPFSGVIRKRTPRQRRLPKRSWKRPQIPLAPARLFGTSATAAFDQLAKR